MVTQSLARRLDGSGTRELSVFDPNAAISSYTFVLTRAVGARIPVITRLKPDVGMIYASRRLLEQSLLMLAVNARNAMPQGGIIVVESSRVEYSEFDMLPHRDAKLGSFVRIAVRDTGCRQNATPYSTVAHTTSPIRRIGHEAGHGFQNLESLLADCDGFLLVDTYPGAGTTFSLHFPEVSELCHPV